MPARRAARPAPLRRAAPGAPPRAVRPAAPRRAALPTTLAGWPAWAAPVALAGLLVPGVLAAVVVVAAVTGAVAGRLALALLAGAGTAAALVWLAARTGEATPARFGLRPCPPRRAAAATAIAVALLGAAAGLLTALGALDGLRAPRELTRLDGLAWAAGAPEAPVPFDADAVASLLARAVLGAAVLELVLRGVVAPALARLVGAWPAILAAGLIGGIAFGGLAGEGRALAPAVVLGVLLGPLAVATGSIVPGAGLAAGFTAAVLAAGCGWSLPLAAACALACAALLAGAGLLAATHAEPAPAPAPGVPRRLAAEHGQTAAEYMGLLLLVSVVVAALFLAGIGPLIAHHAEAIVCRIGGGTCTAETLAIDKDCLVSSSTTKGGGAVLVAVVRVGEESTLLKQVYADGRTVFTLLKNGTVAAELVAGAKAKAGTIGFDLSASISAEGQLAGARTYTFTDPEEAAAFEAQVRKHGSFEQVLRDTAEGFDPFGVKDWVLDHTVGEDVDAGDLPEPDSTYVNADVFLKGEAQALGNVIVADAGARALLQLGGGARIYTSGPDAGKVELNLKLDAEAAANLGLITLGPEVEGKAQFIATVTLDKDNGYRPSNLRVTGRAGYNGDLTDADLRLEPTSGQLDAFQEALKKGKAVDGGSLVSTDGTGQQVEFTGDLALTTDAQRAAALNLFTGGAGTATAAADLAAQLEDRGRLTFQVYDTTTSNTEAGVKVGLGPGVGIEGSQTSDTRDLGQSWVREPGGSWAERNCGG